MTRSGGRWLVAVWLFLFVAIASLALASPWGAPARRVIQPWLPRVVVIVATVSGIGQLVASLVAGIVRRRGWRGASVPLLLGISALFMALAFVPISSEAVPQTLPIVGAALTAISAAVLQHRLRSRTES